MHEIRYTSGPRTYKKPFRNFLDRLSLSLIVVIFCVIVLFIPFWLQVSHNLFFFTISRVINYILNRKVLFVLTNVIVIILIGESRFSRSRSSLPANSSLKEYTVSSTHYCDSWSYGNVKEEMGYQLQFAKENIDRPRLEERKGLKLSLLQMDSLNRRADDLIARVNRRRRLEIGLLHSQIDHSRIS